MASRRQLDREEIQTGGTGNIDIAGGVERERRSEIVAAPVHVDQHLATDTESRDEMPARVELGDGHIRIVRSACAAHDEEIAGAIANHSLGELGRREIDMRLACSAKRGIEIA
ncbi:MAG: hypothetical protein ABIO49_08360 [Dokdonella sp.]